MILFQNLNPNCYILLVILMKKNSKQYRFYYLDFGDMSKELEEFQPILFGDTCFISQSDGLCQIQKQGPTDPSDKFMKALIHLRESFVHAAMKGAPENKMHNKQNQTFEYEGNHKTELANTLNIHNSSHEEPEKVNAMDEELKQDENAENDNENDKENDSALPAQTKIVLIINQFLFEI